MTELPPPPVTPVAVDGRPVRAPRSGELSPGWRIITAVTWIAVVTAMAAVWNTSAQLGLSTWWLGPRGQPRPVAVQLSPFLAPFLMLLGTIVQARWLAWFGLLASATVVAFGVVDLDRVSRLGVVEILIGTAAALISIASFSGTYRAAPRVLISGRAADRAPRCGSPFR